MSYVIAVPAIREILTAATDLALIACQEPESRS
jgi:hypothetical protein